MKALIIGATGATGKDLVNTLLSDASYHEVVTFVRKPTGSQHPKLLEIVTDFENLETASHHMRGDVWFSLLGTTLKTAGSKNKQRHIDYEIPLKFAEIAKRNNVPGVVLLSAYGASSASNVFYSKIKGELEDAIVKLGFDQCIIFMPGLLVRKNTDRLGERTSAAVLNFFNRLGLFRRFRPLPTTVLAEKLAKAPKTRGAGKHIIELDKVFGF
jgi:uncharacterized protein YbjT (DUF2867 family)